MGAAGVHFLYAAGPPGLRIYAIGDVHGRFDLLEEMHARIAQQIARDRPADFRVIHVGDYVDRGPRSRDVLDFLVERTRDPRFVALAGNHDAGFLEFLARPAADGLFAAHGGAETALSYGVRADFSTDRMARETANALLAVMPRAHLAFLEGLPRSVALGDFFFCHAGIRPGIALSAQSADDLIWIRGPFLKHPGLHEKVVVHGHTPAGEPEIMPNRVNIDTGAWMSNVLTAISVEGKRKRILQVGVEDQREAWTTP